MDAQVAAIASALDALRIQNDQSAAFERIPRVFTNAVLNPEKIDILELIRDADPLEASLFAPSRQSDDASDGREEGSRPRLLHPIAVPAPLREGSTDVAALLNAAEGLIQN